ncbi:MAG TPA: indole-3-glycerol phosphate synthase TrpC [Wenzhouxiangellaceae bacterium]|nr:indole-3-glycerol phosphate synthase TrpC [Wenzhouxiangellaceae bacterium]
MSKPSILENIIATKREEVEARRGSKTRSALELDIAALDTPRDFHAALRERAAAGRPAVIAEFKRASPSAGWIRQHADAAQVARAYADGGAACMSVLTDVKYFRGGDEDLVTARAACELPVIRKDFVIDEYQVFETRALGADAMLLIVAALDDARLRDFSALGRELGLSVLVEVHDRAELERALAVPGNLLGINNRDLHRFVTRLETSEELAGLVPDDRVVVAESGIHDRADIERLQARDIHAFLIGEALMKGGDPAATLRALIGSESGPQTDTKDAD